MSSEEKEVPPVSREILKWMGYVTLIGAGLGPIIGTKHVPGFIAIGELFPASMQRQVVAFVTFFMLIPILAVEFYASTPVRRARLSRIFVVFLPLLVVLPMVLYYFFTKYVIQVDFEGGTRTATYVVGSRMEPDCPCVARRLKMARCIGPVISANPAEVTACYDDEEINARRNTLALLYLPMMLSLSAVVGLIVLQRRQQRSKKVARSAAAVPA